ncbi:hypothetical protein [Nitratireductor sp. GCM10026969]|uniref:hypothetical protein n=1 Tax=Nitratireductor sp. GCM10026969 TaxID=3252645 RepID=UPI0036162728
MAHSCSAMHHPRLSEYPFRKVYLHCPKCGIEAQYDRDELIRAGGDRELLDFRLEVARRKGCTKTKIDPSRVFDLCGIVYPDLVKAGQ